jgi:hypothetical protein
MVEAEPLRRRNISWRSDSIARKLAFEKNMTVSELLERLVKAEAARKRGIAHLHPRNTGNPQQ